MCSLNLNFKSKTNPKCFWARQRLKGLLLNEVKWRNGRAGAGDLSSKNRSLPFKTRELEHVLLGNEYKLSTIENFHLQTYLMYVSYLEYLNKKLFHVLENLCWNFLNLIYLYLFWIVAIYFDRWRHPSNNYDYISWKFTNSHRMLCILIAIMYTVFCCCYWYCFLITLFYYEILLCWLAIIISLFKIPSSSLWVLFVFLWSLSFDLYAHKE